MQLEPEIPPGESPCTWWNTFTDRLNRTHFCHAVTTRLEKALSNWHTSAVGNYNWNTKLTKT